MVQMLYKILRKIWMEEKPPKDWFKMILTSIYFKARKFCGFTFLALFAKVFSLNPSKYLIRESFFLRNI